ncbi:MAG: outer membrane protein assembly factor BamD [Alphaproteobacteria bacterium]|nr:outer membrane protein assembly factor BamD [Alphaproteobacteria bacterium]
MPVPFFHCIWLGLRRSALLAAAVVLAGCSIFQEPEAVVERPLEKIYNSALDALLADDYPLAVTEFEQVEAQYPYSEWATRGQLLVAYANYLKNDYTLAIGAAERFIDLHPGSSDVPYVRYLIALCYYEQIPDVRRDQTQTRLAREALEGVIARYPGSVYARDAVVKLDLVYDHLAGKEMEVGRTYLQLRQYPAALRRFATVVRSYSETSHIPEALARMVELNLALGVAGEARQYAAVLGHNYPNNRWYAYAYDLLEGDGPEIPRSSWFFGLF